jgi:hypothetical protein
MMKKRLRTTGANPTIESYNASAVKIYNAKISLVRFEKKFLYKENCASLPRRWR